MLADPALRPSADEIRWMRDAFLDLLRIRRSSTLFRLRSADDVHQRVTLLNTGPEQVPTLVAAHIDGAGYDGARFSELAYFVNVGLGPVSIDVEQARGEPWQLHPQHRADAAADRRPRDAARFDPTAGRFTIPARTAVVFVVEAS